MADSGKREAEYNFKFREDEELEFFTELAVHESERWIQAVTKKSLQFPEDTRKSLENGVLLCQLLNCLLPGSVSRINRLPTPIAGLDNIHVFLKACKTKFGLSDVQLFNPSDLEDLSQRAIAESVHLKHEYDKRLRNVVVTIYWLGKYASRHCQGPKLDLSAYSALIHHRQEPDIVEQDFHPDPNFISRTSSSSSVDWPHATCNSTFNQQSVLEPNDSLEKTASENSSSVLNKNKVQPEVSCDLNHRTYTSTTDWSHRAMSHRRYSSTDSMEDSHYSGQSSHSHEGSDSQEVIYPTRILTTQISRKQSFSTDPLQYVKKRGALDLARTAEVQMRVAAENKQGSVRTSDKDEDSDWQAELNSWKSRRKSQSERTYYMTDQTDGERVVASTSQTKTFSQMQKENEHRRSSRQKFYPIHDGDDDAIAVAAATLTVIAKSQNVTTGSAQGPNDVHSDSDKTEGKRTGRTSKPNTEGQSDNNNNYSNLLISQNEHSKEESVSTWHENTQLESQQSNAPYKTKELLMTNNPNSDKKTSRNIGSRTQSKIGSILKNFEESSAKKSLPKQGYDEKIDLNARKSAFENENVSEHYFENDTSICHAEDAMSDCIDSGDDIMPEIRINSFQRSTQCALSEATIESPVVSLSKYSAQDNFNTRNTDKVISEQDYISSTNIDKVNYEQDIVTSKNIDKVISAQNNWSNKKTDQCLVRRTVRISQKPNSEKGFGFFLSGGIEKQTELYVSKVLLGSAADICDLKVDDIVISVNKTDVSALTAAEVGDIVADSVCTGYIELHVWRKQGEDDFDDFNSSSDEGETNFSSSFNNLELQVRDTDKDSEAEEETSATEDRTVVAIAGGSTLPKNTLEHQKEEREHSGFEPPAILRKWQQQHQQEKDNSSDLYSHILFPRLNIERLKDLSVSQETSDISTHIPEVTRTSEVQWQVNDSARLLEEHHTERMAQIMQSASLASSLVQTSPLTLTVTSPTFDGAYLQHEQGAPLSAATTTNSASSRHELLQPSILQVAKIVSDPRNELTSSEMEFHMKYDLHTKTGTGIAALIEAERQRVRCEERKKLQEERQRAEEEGKNREMEDILRRRKEEEVLQNERELLRLEREQFLREKEEFKRLKDQERLQQKQQEMLQKEAYQIRTYDPAQQNHTGNMHPDSRIFQLKSFQANKIQTVYSSVLHNQQQTSEHQNHPNSFSPVSVHSATKLEPTYNQETDSLLELYLQPKHEQQNQYDKLRQLEQRTQSEQLRQHKQQTQQEQQTLHDQWPDSSYRLPSRPLNGDYVKTVTMDGLESAKNDLRFSREEMLALNRTAKPMLKLPTAEKDSSDHSQCSNIPINREAPSREEIHSLNSVPKAKLRDDADWQSSGNLNTFSISKSVSPHQFQKGTYKASGQQCIEDKGSSKFPLTSSGDHWLIQEAERRRIAESEGRLQSGRSAGSKSSFVGPIKPAGDSPNHWRDRQNQDQFTERTCSSAFMPAAIRQTLLQKTAGTFGSSDSDRSFSHSASRSPSFPHQDNYDSHFSSFQVPRYHHQQQRQYSPQLESPHKQDSLRTPSSSPQRQQEISISGSHQCSHCDQELGYGAAMVIESLDLFFHVQCFRCWVCHASLGTGDHGADVRVRVNKLHCPNCYSNDEVGLKFSKV